VSHWCLAYSLDLKCPSKAMCWKFGHGLWYSWEVVESSEVGPIGKRLGHWGNALGGDIGTLARSSLFCFPSAMRWAVSSTVHSLPCYAASPRLKENKAKRPRTETSETKINLSSWQVVFLGYSITVMESCCPRVTQVCFS
jgi:hypothetical protein